MDQASREQQLASLREDIHKALSGWGKASAAHALDHLLIVQQASGDASINTTQAASQILFDAIDELAAQKPEQARLLRLRYLDGMTMRRVANRFNRSEAAAYKLQRKALDSLTQIMYEQEQTLKQALTEAAITRFGAPEYDQLFGIDSLLDEIMVLLQTPARPWLILLEGIGGIGKTSVADALMRRALITGGFQDIAWVTAKRQIFRLSGRIEQTPAPALSTETLLEYLAAQLLRDTPLPVPFSVDKALPLLRQHLNQAPHLLVIDNLETVSDLAALTPVLRQLARPAKILLTSRRSLHAEANICRFPIPELALPSARQLLRHEAGLRNIRQLAEADDHVLQSIYETVGGNPLALRLVVGQTLIHDLPAVLAALTGARGQTVDRLYTYIYRQAWDSLDECAQRTLLALPLAPPQGMAADLLTQITQLPPSHLLDALDRLVKQNLVERRGDLHQSRYTIHSLTQTFLQEQVAKWQ